MERDNSMEATIARIKAMEQSNLTKEPKTGNDVLNENIRDLNTMKHKKSIEVKSNPVPPNHPMMVRIKRTNPKAVLPKYGHIGEDACFDLTAIDASVDEYGNSVYDFGWAFEIPQGYVGLVFPRSSICKKDMMLGNAVGIIDSGYRSNITAKFRPLDRNPSSSFNHTNLYQVGERVCQMMIVPVPQIEFEVVDELSDTSRGEGGYGSTGK